MKRRTRKQVLWQGGRGARIGEGLKALLRQIIEGIGVSRHGAARVLSGRRRALGGRLEEEVEAIDGRARGP